MKSILTAKQMLQIVNVLSSEEIEISMGEVVKNLQRMKENRMAHGKDVKGPSQNAEAMVEKIQKLEA